MANSRPNLSKTKKRGEVSGGGAKPHRQKGTGRARAGSIRSPLWRGGGITFGPSGLENFARKMSVSSKRKAIRQALSLAASSGKIIVIDEFEVKDGKTKSAQKLLSKIGASGEILMVLNSASAATKQSLRNITDVSTISAKYLSVFRVLNADKIVITKTALGEVSKWLGMEAASE